MSHEISFVGQREGDAFYVREPAWHRYGIVLENPPTLDEALQTAKLGYTVEKRPVYIHLPNGLQKQSEKAFVTIRTDTSAELGSVGPSYTPVQNRDAFRAIEPLLDSGVVELDAGGVLRGGADAWLLGKFNIERFGPIVREVFAEEVTPYVSFKCNHSGRRLNSVSLTPVREVCWNTLTLSEVLADAGRIKEIQIRHSGDAVQKTIEAAEKLLGGIIERYETVARHFKVLKATFLTEEQFKELVLDAVSPDPRTEEGFNPEAKLADLVVERHEKRVAEVTRLWTQGAGHTGDRSAWEAWNGAVEAIDHNEDVFPVRGGAWKRGQSLLDGDLRNRKQLVLDNLLTVACFQEGLLMPTRRGRARA